MGYLTPEDIEIAEANGISERLAKQRFYQKGWSKERSITEPIREDRWHQYKELCEKNGITNDTFRNRINKRGMTPEQAATKPIRTPVVTPELIALAESNGIKKSTLKARISLYKWDPQDAATIPIGSTNPKKPKRDKRRLWFL
jgi:hypothetical protein